MFNFVWLQNDRWATQLCCALKNVCVCFVCSCLRERERERESDQNIKKLKATPKKCLIYSNLQKSSSLTFFPFQKSVYKTNLGSNFYHPFVAVSEILWLTFFLLTLLTLKMPVKNFKPPFRSILYQRFFHHLPHWKTKEKYAKILITAILKCHSLDRMFRTFLQI